MHTALVLIDIQTDYFPEGAIELMGMTCVARPWQR